MWRQLATTKPVTQFKVLGVAYAFALARASTSVRLGSATRTLVAPLRPLVLRETLLLPLLLPLGRDDLLLLLVPSAFFSGLLAGQRDTSKRTTQLWLSADLLRQFAAPVGRRTVFA